MWHVSWSSQFIININIMILTDLCDRTVSIDQIKQTRCRFGCCFSNISISSNSSWRSSVRRNASNSATNNWWVGCCVQWPVCCNSCLVGYYSLIIDDHTTTVHISWSWSCCVTWWMFTSISRLYRRFTGFHCFSFLRSKHLTKLAHNIQITTCNAPLQKCQKWNKSQ